MAKPTAASITPWLAALDRRDIRSDMSALALKKGTNGLTRTELALSIKAAPRLRGMITPDPFPGRSLKRISLADDEAKDILGVIDAAVGFAIRSDEDDAEEGDWEKALALWGHVAFTVRNWRLRANTVGGQFQPAAQTSIITEDVQRNIKSRRSQLGAMKKDTFDRGDRGRGARGGRRGRDRGRGRGGGGNQSSYRPSQGDGAPQSDNRRTDDKKRDSSAGGSRYGANYKKPKSH